MLSDQLFSSAVETDDQLIELLMNANLNWVRGEGEGYFWISFCHYLSNLRSFVCRRMLS